MSDFFTNDIKHQLQFRDRLINFIAEDGQTLITLVKSSQVVKDCIAAHKLDGLSAYFMAQLLTLNLLLTRQLKGEERVNVSVKTDSALKLLQTEANALGEIRGFCSVDYNLLNKKNQEEPLSLLAAGTLSTHKVLYGQAMPYTGVVELVDQSLSRSFENFFHLSEQTPAAAKVDVDFDEYGQLRNSVGILITTLPQSQSPIIQEDFYQGDFELAARQFQELLQKMPKMTDLLTDNFYLDAIVDYVWPQKVFHESLRRNVDFFCRCNRELMLSHLGMLAGDDLLDLAQDRQSVLQCHYCSKSYIFEREEILNLQNYSRR